MAYIIDEDNLTLCLLVTIAMQLSFFAVAFTFKFDKVTDFAGGTNFILLALLTFFLGQTYTERQYEVTVFVTLWGIRISGFLLFRILKLGKDDRFDGRREDFFKFLAFWIFQIIWVFIVSLPVIFINSSKLALKSDFPTAWDIVGGVIFVFGLTIETVADFQKFYFKQDPSRRGQWCNTGLWSWSRHPNYFGEMLVWIGVFLIGVSIYRDFEWVSLFSPLFTMSILLFLSGAPLLEKAMNEKHGTNPAFKAYINSVSPVILMPPVIYKSLPQCVKVSLFCEFPFYRKGKRRQL